jgi:hypothetical protein
MSRKSEFFFSNIIRSVLVYRSDAYSINYQRSSSFRLWTIFFSICLSIFWSTSKNQCVFLLVWLTHKWDYYWSIDTDLNALLLTFFHLCLQKHRIRTQFFVIKKVYLNSPIVFQNFANHFFYCILIDNSFSAWV